MELQLDFSAFDILW